MKKRVLFVDNDPDFLDTRVEQLERAGFDVFKATSFEQAEQILSDHWVHLTIVDLRLRDDSDDRDTSGLTLAKQEPHRSIPKIILTRFPSYEHVREALGPTLDGLPLAVNFLAKQEGPEVMMQAVEQAFTKYVRINWDLEIHWNEREPLSFLHLITLIEPEIDNARLLVRVGELEDLFRKLFYDSHQININRLLAQRPGKVFLVVFAYSERGTEEQFVVACGQKQSIIDEDALYELFVPKVTGPGGIVKRGQTEETAHFAATAYRFIGGDLEDMTTFSEFYRDHSAETVTTALDHLFTTTLVPWYSRDRFLEENRTLDQFFLAWSGLSGDTFSQTGLECRLEDICQKALAAGLAKLDYSSHKLTFYLADGSPVSYPNPFACLFETQLVFDLPLLCGTTHGQLNGNNILVDDHGQTWLIDFSQVDQGPLLRDFVSLETAIKFDLLATRNVQVRHEMERRLLTAAPLDEAPNTDDLEPEVQKAVRVISRVRQQASTVIGHDITAYLEGLLFCTIDRLFRYDPKVRHTRRELIPYLHGLLSAAMLCQKLIPPPRQDLPSEALHSIWVDQANKEVWVEGRKVELAPGEYDLLVVLYRRANQLCTRQDISQEVYGMDYGRETEDAINTTMARLRRKIEFNSKHPKYIITVRGEGYRLELGSSPPFDLAD